MHGTIARLSPEGGFGFITADDGQELFFHRSALQGVEFEELAPGQPVHFQISRDNPGDEPGEHARAVSVQLADDAPPAEDHTLLSAEKTR
jgi:cold shock protein